MEWSTLFLFIIVVVVFLYMLYALFNPEKF